MVKRFADTIKSINLKIVSNSDLMLTYIPPLDYDMSFRNFGDSDFNHRHLKFQVPVLQSKTV